MLHCSLHSAEEGWGLRDSRLHYQPPNAFLILGKNVEYTLLQGLIKSTNLFK